MNDNVLKYVKRLISEGRDRSTWISGNYIKRRKLCTTPKWVCFRG